MKKYLLIVLSFMLVVAQSCKKENGTGGNTFFKAKTERFTEDRANLQGLDVVWNVNDEFRYFSDNGESATARIKSGFGTNCAEFTGIGSLSSSAVAFYGNKPEDVNHSGNCFAFEMPQNQVYVKDGIAPELNPMIGTVANDEFSFSNIFGLLRLNVSGTGIVGSVKVVGKEGMPLWGAYSVDLGSMEVSSNGNNRELLLECRKGVFLEEGKPVPFYMVLPPNALSNGYEIILQDVGGHEMLRVEGDAAEMCIRRNTVLSMDLKVEIVPPEGALKGLFSVSDDLQVFFSKGNLQYVGSASSPYWKFADRQNEALGLTTGQNSESKTVDRDLFGWATSGYRHGSAAYHPWSTVASYHNSNYAAYSDFRCNLYDNSCKADWGYNAISNGGNVENMWRTLKKTEWVYLFESRENARNLYGMARVGGVSGLVILPDYWNWLLPDLALFSESWVSGHSSFVNEFTETEWNVMELHGAVFLPAAGLRNGVNVFDVGSFGYYWSADAHAMEFAFMFYFCDVIASLAPDNRYSGHSVRLVRDFHLADGRNYF